MRLEAVTVCVNYGDFLAETAKHNAMHFDRWVVVTKEDDKETREVCRRRSIQCALSSECDRNPPFNKGRMIHRGLSLLGKDCFVLHLDADIVLPKYTRKLLEAAHLREDEIYGCDRLMVKGWDEWQKLKANDWLDDAHDYHCRGRFPHGFTIGARWADLHHGYVPIGFFQLWNRMADIQNGINIRPYPSEHNDASRADVQHGLQWDRRSRELLPELVVAHLESEPAPLGANWKGRTTKRFGPSDPEAGPTGY